jgi:beta-galactosidase GanA
MVIRPLSVSAVGALLLFVCVAECAERVHAQQAPLPELRQVGRAKQLFVDGKPLLILGGELGNSTASDLATLETSLQSCRRTNLNAVLLPVYWDLIEPVEGEFDFTLVEGALERARDHDLRLVLLWFGTWKNSMSCYAPSWVKRDTTRFARAQQRAGAVLEVISPASGAACDADARAFVELMRFLREHDSNHHTVVMIQIENEVGMIPEPRDYSPAAEELFGADVPDELLSLLIDGKLGPEVTAIWNKAGRKPRGKWSEVFGAEPEGEEVFSAWQFASYIERIAAAGKREYPLPMLANAALIRPGYRPNQYPSGGPLPHLMEVWQAAAPSLDMICPDIYFPNFMEWCQRYVRNDNPLFVPEMAPSTRASGNALHAIANFGAMGVAPFSIENVGGEKQRLIASCYEALSGLTDIVLQAQQNGTVIGLSPQVGFDWNVDAQPQRGELDGVVFEALFDRPPGATDVDLTTLPTHGPGRWEAPPGTPLGAVMVLQLGPEEFAIVGMGATVTFAPADGKGKVGIDRVQEGRYADGTWIGGRWLNGDQTHQGRHVRFDSGRWSVQRVTLYRY